jgi:mono/diheme cytochrome c family protein
MNQSIRNRSWPAILIAAVISVSVAPVARAATPAELLAGYSAQAGGAASPERGQRFFNTNFGRDYASCATCHGAVPTKAGKDAATEKPIGALAPAFNPARFTDKAKVENLFRLNCKDVVGRECTAAEKADVLSWLLSLKP